MGLGIAHSCVGTANECRITKNDPRLLRAGEKSSPEDINSHRGVRNVARKLSLSRPAIQESIGGNGDDSRQYHRQHDDGGEPLSDGPSRDGNFNGRLKSSIRFVCASSMRAVVKTEGITALGQLHQNVVLGTLGCIVFSQFGPKASRLNSNGGIEVGIEVWGSTENLCRNLILLNGGPRMMDGLVRQILEHLAKGFGAMQDMA